MLCYRTEESNGIKKQQQQQAKCGDNTYDIEHFAHAKFGVSWIFGRVTENTDKQTRRSKPKWFVSNSAAEPNKKNETKREQKTKRKTYHVYGFAAGLLHALVLVVVLFFRSLSLSSLFSPCSKCATPTDQPVYNQRAHLCCCTQKHKTSNTISRTRRLTTVATVRGGLFSVAALFFGVFYVIHGWFRLEENTPESR